MSLGIVSKVLWSNTYKGEELQVAEKGQELSKWQEAKVTRTEMRVRRMITMMMCAGDRAGDGQDCV